MSMRMKTTLLIILIVLITTAANFFSGLYFTSSSLEKTVEQDLAFAIAIADSLVGTKMTLMKTEAATVAAHLLSAGTGDALSARMAEQLAAYPDISALALFNRGGVIASYSEPAHEHDLNLHAEYLDRVYGGATIISSPFYCSTQGEYVMNVYTPMGEDAILAVTMPGATFSNMLAEHRLWQSGDIFMLNEVGMFIGGADGEIIRAAANYLAEGEETAASQGEAIDALVQIILNSDHGVERYVYEGEERLCAYSRISDSALGWRVAVSVPLSESPQADAQQGQLYAAALFLLVGAAAAIFLSRVTSEPFKKIEAQNKDLAALNETIRAQAAALRDAHERTQVMLDATPLACRLWSRDFRLLEGNEAAVKLFALKDKQEYIDRYFELSPEYQPDGQPTRDKIKEIVAEAFEKGACTHIWEYRTADGSPLPCELTLVRVPYGDDYAVAGYSRDLREQHRMLAAIERRDALRAVVNQAADSLLRAEPDDFEHTLRECLGMMARSICADRMYISQNEWEDEAFYRRVVCEWTKAEPTAHCAEAGRVSYEESTPAVREALLNGRCANMLVSDMAEADRLRLGACGILAVLLVPVFIGEVFWGFVGLNRRNEARLFSETEEAIMRSGSLLAVNALLRNEDLRRIRDTSVKLEAALAEAEEAGRAKTDFLAHMSHEIRTPLNAVIGLSELTLGEGNLSRGAEVNLEKVCAAGATILSIVNDILDISKIESGKFELNPIRYDTPSLINDTVTLNIVRVGEKPIVFRLYVDENLPVALIGDDLRVKQIFNNLLSNAFKYTHAGEVEWRIAFETDEKGVSLVSSVRDTGVGIKPEDMRKLFTEYHQVDTKANRAVEGTGLGLAITKRLVSMIGGDISVESEYGKGSVFRVRLRQTVASAEPIGREVAQNLMEMHYALAKRGKHTGLTLLDLSYAHVLVVDDIETNLDVVKGMLKPYGVCVHCVTDGRQAIERIRAENPRYSAVFMDHMMPGMDGIEAARVIRQEIGTEYARKVPIIALTANAIVGNEEMFLNRGFQAFVSKPIDTAKLDYVLRQWVRDKRKEQDLRDKAAVVAETEVSGELLPCVPSVAGMDVERARARFGGREAALRDVLQSYARNIPPLLTGLAAALAAGDASA